MNRYRSCMVKVSPIPEALWQQVPAEVQAVLEAVFARYEERIACLQQQVEQLQQPPGQNSTNSSKPPSSDGPQVKRQPPKPRSGKRRGAQPGHTFQQRPLLPADDTRPLKPSNCRGCGHPLQGVDPQPLRHQVLELPVLRPLVTEYQLHRLSCPQCGLQTCATLPAGVPQGGYGPRFQAVVSLLTGHYRLSKRLVVAFCQDICGVPLSVGQVCALEQQTARATDPVVQPLVAHAATQSANVDETSWRQANQRAWLWVVVTASVTVFRLRLSRAAAVAKELLQLSAGQIITTDRYRGYAWIPLAQRRLCWAHLLRDFQAMIDRQTAGSAIGQQLLDLGQLLFSLWHRVRDGTLSRAAFARLVREGIRPDLQGVLQRGLTCGCAKTAGTCQEVLAVEPALWTFVRVAGLEPTNNAGERAHRHAVQWRKSSFGTQSAAGSHYVENVLTVVATCRQQGRNVLEILTACAKAALEGTPPPSLLPTTTA